jgi:hypothetical protein
MAGRILLVLHHPNTPEAHIGREAVYISNQHELCCVDGRKQGYGEPKSFVMLAWSDSIGLAGQNQEESANFHSL